METCVRTMLNGRIRVVPVVEKTKIGLAEFSARVEDVLADIGGQDDARQIAQAWVSADYDLVMAAGV